MKAIIFLRVFLTKALSFLYSCSMIIEIVLTGDTDKSNTFTPEFHTLYAGKGANSCTNTVRYGCKVHANNFEAFSLPNLLKPYNLLTIKFLG